MKKFLISSLFIFLVSNLLAQGMVETKYGSVSFISSQNIYVQFVNTDGINIGDTLFVLKDKVLKPAIVVNNLSSISCVGSPINAIQLPISTQITAVIKVILPVEVITEKLNESVAVNDLVQKTSRSKDSTKLNRERFDGRISVSSYSNFASNPLSLSTPNYRLRYNLSLNAENIAKSNFSFDNYMSFTHTFNSPLALQDLKIYNLALSYSGKSSTWNIGRKINANTSNIGAVDGIQYEKRFKNISLGALAGFRPNDTTYGLDFKLLQYGAFISHNFQRESLYSQTSIGYFNQTNNFKTDRRYLYLQHANSILKNLDVFASAEVDLYNGVGSSFNLTSAYMLLNYHPFSKLTLSLSYDARKNIYFYETYKNRIDSTLEKETRQGLRFRFNYRPFKFVSWGGNAGYRIHTPTSDESMNAISYLTFSKLPFINSSLTLTGTALSTANMSGFIYGASMSKEFFDGKLAADIEYRKALIFAQDIAEISLSWRISKKLLLTTNYELSFEAENTFQRLFINLTQRF